MKKLLLLLGAVALIATKAAAIDNTFTFVDASGNSYNDGDTITLTTVEFVDDGLDAYYQISSGLYVKNNTAEQIGAGIDFDIARIDNGNLSVCFPGNCYTYNTVGTYSQSGGYLDASVTKTLQTEWIMTGYGECDATFTLTVFDISYNKYGLPTYTQREEDGPTITVHFVYSDPAGIRAISSVTNRYEVARYTISGRQIDTPQKGLNIVKYSDGTVRKVIVK